MNPIIPHPGTSVHVRTPIEIPQLLGGTKYVVTQTTVEAPILSEVTAFVHEPVTDGTTAGDSRAAVWLVPPSSLNGLGFQYIIGSATDATGLKACVTYAALQALDGIDNDATTAKQPLRAMRKFVAKYELTAGSIDVPAEHVKRLVSAADYSAYTSWKWVDTWTLVGTSYLASSGLQSFGPHEKGFDVWSNLGVEVYAACTDSVGNASAEALTGTWRGIQL